MVVSYLMLMICVLVGVAFVTLLERKILGYIQIRKGPNKLGILGLLQPFSDAVKLFAKEQGVPLVSNFLPYYLSPIFSLFIALIMWSVIPYELGLVDFDMSMLFFLCCLSLGVYPLMGAGWSSNCKYSLLGSLRAVAQTISYEVSLALILLSYIFLTGSFSFGDLSLYQESMWFFWVTIPLSMVWLGSCLAEMNRTPFDFAEGESELVSGFNTEYSSGGFVLIFMAEYVSILFMSGVSILLFLGGSVLSLGFYMKLVMVSFLFIWVRGTLPRLRYDKLMYMAWKSFLPLSLNFLVFFMGLKLFLI
uniref:NADH-ubiquinone oxidoreductase chain 1 n=1 Tax=Cherax destructor TaxID=6723 RepID=W6MVZ7_CHEDE|nr:NADH dehydrogenase subunit 1 [Cherax destructor]WRV01073.1 NADH dehydrogenase subunit 1 [Cherax destructor albidus]AIA61536.1 NADH dehydrogenase subunit 1 [Cherax destructor]UNJ13903.1 NADH dehydrogenase subunit 1 [Cherax destructor]CDL72631.1 NADH dehydrogenase subunit 1 [Cherax destructor]